MSAALTPSKPAGKSRTMNAALVESPSSANAAATALDDMIPLLLAANPGLTVNYKQMAALDKQKRTYSSIEHKFRKWRAIAKEITEGATTASGEASKDSSDVQGGGITEKLAVRKRKTASDEAHEDSEDEVEAPVKKPKATRKASARATTGAVAAAKKGGAPKIDNEDKSLSEGEAPQTRPTTSRKGPAKAPTFGDGPEGGKEGSSGNEGEDATAKKANVAKKRDDKVIDVATEVTAKKPRAPKKGTARIVKKGAMRGGADEGIAEDDEDVGSKAIVRPKGTAKKVKAETAAKPAAKGKGKKVKAVEEDHEVEMQFD